MVDQHGLRQVAWRLALLALPALLATACSSAGEPAPAATAMAITAPVAPTNTSTALPSPAALPTDTPMPPQDTATPALDTPTPAPPPATPFPAATPPAIATLGQTAEGLYFRGSPDPTALTVIDYSDFL